MSYLVLARKWRPQRFSDVIGQDHVVNTLKKAVEKGRLAHAYLFAGPRGCGKTTTARLLAKVINCANPVGAEPCNECPSCKAVNEGRHLDVIEIDGASNRGIDEIRDLRERIGYAPSQGKSKIYIIDEVHMLTPQAFNALLKTLEEPPPHVYLIFATTEPQKVPATILSRCQRFNFKRLELSELVGQLEKICKEEKIDYEHDALVLLSRRAEGSMRDAESLLDQCISASEGKINLKLVREVLGLMDSQVVNELLASIASRDRAGTLAIVDRVVSSGADIEEFFLSYIEGLRNLLVMSIYNDGKVDMLDLTSDEVESLRKILGAFKTEDLLLLFRHAVMVYRDLRYSNQPRYMLEAAFSEAASWSEAVELSELIERIDRAGSATGGLGGAGTGTNNSFKGKGTQTEGMGGSSKSRGGSIEGAAFVDREFSKGASGVESTAVHTSDSKGNVSTVRAGTSSEGQAHRSEASSQRLPVSREEGLVDDDVGALSKLGGREAWSKFLASVRESKLTLGIWLNSAKVKGVEENRLFIDFSPQNRFAREMVFEEKNRRYIENQLEKFFGRRYALISSGSAGRTETEKPPADDKPGKKARAADAELAEEPFVKRVIEEFDGEIIKKTEKRKGDKA